MADEDTIPPFPRAIYFDTSALRAAGHALRKPWMDDLRNMAKNFSLDLNIPELVMREWFVYLRRECINDLKKAIQIGTFLNEVLGHNPISVEEYDHDRICDLLAQHYLNQIKEAGFNIIPTASIDLKALLTESVEHVAPFTQKDKGFRDAVIVESIAEHAAATYDPCLIVVASSDSAFHKAMHRFKKRNVDVIITSPSEAFNELEKARVEVLGQFLEHGDPTANEFLNGHKDMIFEAVRKAPIRISKYGLSTFLPSLIGNELKDATIHRINDARPSSIGRAYPSMRPIHGKVEEGRYCIQFTVEVELDLTISYPPIFGGLFSGSEITLDQPTDLDNIPTIYPETRTQRIEKTVTRSVSVDSTVIYDKKNSERPYSDLRIEHVWGLN